MSKTAATAKARRILRYGYFNESPTRSYAFVDGERVYADHPAWATTSQRIAACRSAIITFLTENQNSV
jgi:hypothetical protein